MTWYIRYWKKIILYFILGNHCRSFCCGWSRHLLELAISVAYIAIYVDVSFCYAGWDDSDVLLGVEWIPKLADTLCDKFKDPFLPKGIRQYFPQEGGILPLREPQELALKKKDRNERGTRTFVYFVRVFTVLAFRVSCSNPVYIIEEVTLCSKDTWPRITGTWHR